jgi:hypothetical protein
MMKRPAEPKRLETVLLEQLIDGRITLEYVRDLYHQRDLFVSGLRSRRTTLT